jgi:hypothetical protein
MSTPTNPPADDGITLKMVMDHIQHQWQMLMGEIKNVWKEIRDLRKEMNERFRDVEHRLTIQIDGIDQRLDAIEIENIPKRMRRVEKHLKLAAV